MPVAEANVPESTSYQTTFAGLEAAVFDLDGTLYDQNRFRVATMLKLLVNTAAAPRGAWETIRILRSYRKAQEWMRCHDRELEDLAETQLKLACEWSQADDASVRCRVRVWMEERPTQCLMRYRVPKVVEFLEELKNRGFKIAVCSDYPAVAKLRALGVMHYFKSVKPAQDADVQHFKPHPRVLEAALYELGASAPKAVYFGDRPEVDGIAAHRAGMSFVKTSPRLGFGPLLQMLVGEGRL